MWRWPTASLFWLATLRQAGVRGDGAPALASLLLVYRGVLLIVSMKVRLQSRGKGGGM